MGFASSARFARCRSGHLSYFLRRSNAQAFSVHRGLSTSAISAVCAELRPPAGFPEQRISSILSDAASASGDVSAGAETPESLQALAALIDGAIAETSAVTYSETLLGIRFMLDCGDHSQCIPWMNM
eukprot:TRINITY_DN74595_c0_g1_i1.p1 TRINITY_DN74595_c0_g1~~TRINITY_DN74595_c0_g1_i1.p1  ORF type:complete len:127 (-),score=20.00 TRINITY_DN74595_c0_g1_i1:131-511(-)